MQRSQFLLQLALPILASSSTAALSTDSVDMTWPSSSSFAPTSYPTRNVPGHFSAAYAEDVIVLRGTQPVLLVEPGFQTHFKSWR